MFANTFLKNRIFLALAFAIIAFTLSYSFPWFFRLGQILLLILFLLTFLEWFLLFRISDKFEATRKVANRLSLGDQQEIEYTITNLATFSVLIEVVDELPYQLQKRDSTFFGRLDAGEKFLNILTIRPLIRGSYAFGDLHLYISLPRLSFVQRRISLPCSESVMVVPSIIQMKRYELEVFSRTASLSGIRRVRTIGEDDEFEHIRTYQQGDNIRSINWKATSRKNQPMINQFQNSRAQMVYCIIDKGRSMKMPFEGLTLLDHAINASLVISNIVLKKYDRGGLVTFSDKIGKIIAAENIPSQLSLISKHLYDQQTGFKESNYELLFYTLQHHIRRRSILLFFTNFEHLYDLDRNLEYFQALNRKHLLVIIFFINTDILVSSEMNSGNVGEIYLKTFAQETLIEKELILNKLKGYGIQSILTKPHDLSISVINKYLEIKAKRMK